MDSMDENRDAEKLGETSEEQDQDRKYQNSEDVEAEVVDEEQMPDVNEEEYEEDEDAEGNEDAEENEDGDHAANKGTQGPQNGQSEDLNVAR